MFSSKKRKKWIQVHVIFLLHPPITNLPSNNLTYLRYHPRIFISFTISAKVYIAYARTPFTSYTYNSQQSNIHIPTMQ